jgi:hypothetical protein
MMTLEQFMVGRTTLVIAHKLELFHFEQVIRLAGGLNRF